MANNLGDYVIIYLNYYLIIIIIKSSFFKNEKNVIENFRRDLKRISNFYEYLKTSQNILKIFYEYQV